MTKRKAARKRRPMTAQEMGKKGGHARARKLTAEQRSAIARKGAIARHAKSKIAG